MVASNSPATPPPDNHWQAWLGDMVKRTPLKNPHREIALFKFRAIMIAIGMTLLLLLLLARLIYLQINQQNFYSTLSTQNLLTVLPIEPKRGLIYDRNGMLLAKNIPVFSLEIIPAHINNLPATIHQLRKFIKISDEEIHYFNKQRRQHRHYEPVPLKIRLTEEELSRFYVNQHRFPGVTVQARLIREYPLGLPFSHVLGYVGRINEKEMAEVDSENYSATHFMGKVGIEKFYEDTLHGTVGYQQIETDATGRIVRILKRTPPIAGQDLMLTLDSSLQLAADKALGDHQGAVVAIDPSNGEVLALVSHPSYDPNQFVTGIDQKSFKTLAHSADRPLYNRALRGLYPIASTIKPFVALEGLKTHTIKADTMFFDKGRFQLPHTHHVFRDWRDDGHGWIDLTAAIIESCDTFFYDLAVKLGIEKLDSTLHAFGFGESTGIDMGEELAGVVPSPEWKQAMKGQRWYLGDTVITGIGQGYTLATPLQLANATAGLSMHGQRFQPHLLLHRSKGNKRQVTEAIPLGETYITKPAYWNTVINAMRRVIREGTGFRFGHDAHYTIAAKTGTAETFTRKKYQYWRSGEPMPEKLRDHSLFIAFAPTKNPKIAVAIIVEHSNQAPIVARKIMDHYLIAEHHQGTKHS